MHLTATLRDLDAQRAHRLLIAWCTGDKLAADVVLHEAMGDPIGTPGLVLALTEFAATLGEQVTDDFVDQLRAALLEDEDHQ